jgi:glutamate transport system substrate-binding protein
VALAVVLALVAGACGKDDKTTTKTNGGDSDPSKPAGTFPAGSTMAAIQTKGKLVVGTKFDQPLFGLKNPTNGQIEGFDVEIAKLMAQAIFGGTRADAAKKIDFVETVSKVREPSITDGRVDIVVATYTINDTRKQIVAFAGPYYVAGQDIMVKKDNNSIKSVSDLNGKKVCSVQGSTSIKNVQQQAPQADLSISFDVYSKCAEALKDGRVEAVTTDDSILAGLVKDNKDAFKLVGKPFTKEPYGIGLKKGDDAFRTFLNDTLESIERSGDWAKAWERTVGTAGIPTPTPPAIDRYTSTASSGGVTSTTGGSGSSSSSSTTTSSTPSTSSSSSSTTAP